MESIQLGKCRLVYFIRFLKDLCYFLPHLDKKIQILRLEKQVESLTKEIGALKSREEASKRLAEANEKLAEANERRAEEAERAVHALKIRAEQWEQHVLRKHPNPQIKQKQ